MKHLFADPNGMKPKAKCKPCITIRTVLRLLWENYVIAATKNFRDDYRSYSRVNATACELDHPSPLRMMTYENEVVNKIRKLAKENFDDGKKLSEALEERKAK